MRIKMVVVGDKKEVEQSARHMAETIARQYLAARDLRPMDAENCPYLARGQAWMSIEEGMIRIWDDTSLLVHIFF